MKQILCLVCLLALLLSACSVAEQAPAIPQGNDTQGIYQLTFQAKQLTNDYPGNDWSFTYTHNGHTVKSGDTITQSLEVFSFQSIDVKVRENDRKGNVVTGTLRVAICDGGSGKTQVTVTEKKGHHKGSTSVWEISCAVALVDKPQNREATEGVSYRRIGHAFSLFGAQKSSG